MKIIRNKTDSDMFLVGIKVDCYTVGYNEDLYALNVERINDLGGEIYLIDNDSNFTDQYGSIDNRETASQEAAKVVDDIIGKYGDTYYTYIVLCVDTPFLGVPRYSKYADTTKVNFVIALHSTAKIHLKGMVGTERLNYEYTAIDLYATRENIFFAKTSEFLGHHLVEEYKLPAQKLVPLQSGILPEDDKYALSSSAEIQCKLEEYNIDVNKNLIFSMGRAEVYKGFSYLIEACKALSPSLPFHLVIICAPYTSEDHVLNSIKETLTQSSLSYTLIEKPDFELPKYICQRRKTRVVAQLSLAEPFGLIPEDVRCWARKGGPVIFTSDKDGYIEQITDGVDGFLVNLDVEEIAKKLHKIFLLDKSELSSIRNAGYKRALSDYDFSHNLVSFLDCFRDNA